MDDQKQNSQASNASSADASYNYAQNQQNIAQNQYQTYYAQNAAQQQAYYDQNQVPQEYSAEAYRQYYQQYYQQNQPQVPGQQNQWSQQNSNYYQINQQYQQQQQTRQAVGVVPDNVSLKPKKKFTLPPLKFLIPGAAVLILVVGIGVGQTAKVFNRNTANPDLSSLDELSAEAAIEQQKKAQNKDDANSSSSSNGSSNTQSASESQQASNSTSNSSASSSSSSNNQAISSSGSSSGGSSSGGSTSSPQYCETSKPPNQVCEAVLSIKDDKTSKNKFVSKGAAELLQYYPSGIEPKIKENTWNSLGSTGSIQATVVSSTVTFTLEKISGRWTITYADL